MIQNIYNLILNRPILQGLNILCMCKVNFKIKKGDVWNEHHSLKKLEWNDTYWKSEKLSEITKHHDAYKTKNECI